jgi:hypothetical protein
MKIPTTDDIASIIDTAFFGVDKSKLGPIMQYPNDNPMERQYNKVAFQVFLSVTLAMIAKADFTAGGKDGKD